MGLAGTPPPPTWVVAETMDVAGVTTTDSGYGTTGDVRHDQPALADEATAALDGVLTRHGPALEEL